MEPILDIQNLHYRYPGGPEALAGISLSIERGSKIALVGPNGAGKTTLLLMFNGMLRPASGRVCLNGTALTYSSKALREVRKQVGLVFQHSDAQLFAPTVYQDVAFGPLNLGLPDEEVRSAVNDALASVGLLGYERRPPHLLSGGEMKRVAIAGILAMGTEVLVFDEPTSSLDPASAEEIMDLLDELNAAGKTIIISTHDVELAYRWAERIILMDGGTIIHEGTPEHVFGQSHLLKAARLKPPVVLDIYQELSGRGVCEGSDAPRTVLQLTDILDGALCGERRREDNGAIHVCDVDAVALPVILGRLGDRSRFHIGVMGTRAKLLAQKADLVPDFTYGVIDKCILRALNGEDSMILTSAGMVEHASRRIKEYCRQSGKEITLVLVEERQGT